MSTFLRQLPNKMEKSILCFFTICMLIVKFGKICYFLLYRLSLRISVAKLPGFFLFFTPLLATKTVHMYGHYHTNIVTYEYQSLFPWASVTLGTPMATNQLKLQLLHFFFQICLRIQIIIDNDLILG